MSDATFDLEAWQRRIGHEVPCPPTLATLRAVIAAHSSSIPYENIDVLLGRPPKLDLASLQQKMVAGRRGGYCFEQNMLLRAGLLALGFRATGRMARVVRGMAADAPPRPALHMVLRVDLPEGSFLADVGFGNLTPTAPLLLRPNLEQETPHETMRLISEGEELTLQVKLLDDWESLYRILPYPCPDADYEVGNWFTATHRSSPFVSNLVAARAGPEGIRYTFFNGRLSVRRPPNQLDRRMLNDRADYEAVLAGTFGLALCGADLSMALETLDRKGTLGATHPFFS